jgi:predicted AlkP superfamily phosphohydrolase/phosphomutase
MRPLTLLFGLDGATYSVLDDLIARGLMPNLAGFLETGVRATMMSTTPPLTPPAWTTLATGRPPGVHGVFGFFQYDAPESTNIQLISARQVAAETLWSMVNRQGRRAGVLNYVAHQPAPKIDGWVIPGWVTSRWVRPFSHPPGLIDGLRAALPGFDVKTLAIDLDEESKAVAGAPIDDYRAWVNLHIRRERLWFDVLWRLAETDPVDLAAIVFDGVDKLQHGLWPYVDPMLVPENPSPEFLRVRETAWEYYKTVDELLGESMRRAGEDATILICSDHGFTGSGELLYINTWLEQQGYLAWRPGYDPPEDSFDLNPAAYQHNAFDMSRTKAYAIITSSNGIHIPVRRTPEGVGVPPEQYESFRRELMDALLVRCIDPETGKRLVTRVWTREEIFSGPRMKIAPDLTLRLRDHGFFSVRRSTRVHARRPLVLGTHHPEGVLMARGPGIRRGVRIDPVHLIDVAPTVLYNMDLDVPADLPGRPLTEMYRDSHVAARPVRRSLGAEAPPSITPVAARPPEAAPDESEILEKLKMLGYIE